MKKLLFTALLLAFAGFLSSLQAQAPPVTLTTIQQYLDPAYDYYGLKIVTTSSNQLPYNVTIRCPELGTDTTYTMAGAGSITAMMALNTPIQMVVDHTVHVTVKQGVDSTTGQVQIQMLVPTPIDVLVGALDTINGGNNVLIMGSVYNYDGFAGTATVRIYDSQNVLKYQEAIPYFEVQTFVEPTLIATQADISQWEPGLYSVTLQAQNSWVTSYESTPMYFEKYELTGISSTQAPELKVWPNPFVDEVQINVAEPNIDIVLQDAFGRIYVTEHLTGIGKHTLSTSSLPQGIYFLTFNKGSRKIKTTLITK